MGADEAASIDTSYKVEVNAAPDGARGGTIDGAGAVLVRDWVQGRSSASWNPLFIVTGQLWYNAFTSDYELKLWLEPDGGASGRQYAIYQSGSRFVLRTEYDGVAQVRRADFTAEELWQELQPHVKPRETR